MRAGKAEQLDFNDAPHWITPDQIGCGVASYSDEMAGCLVVLKIVGGRLSEPDTVQSISIALDENRLAGMLVQLSNASKQSGMKQENILRIAANATEVLRNASESDCDCHH